MQESHDNDHDEMTDIGSLIDYLIFTFCQVLEDWRKLLQSEVDRQAGWQTVTRMPKHVDKH